MSGQSPDELFDVVTAAGVPTGQRLTRHEIHRAGHWHRAIHIWIVARRVEGPVLLFQRRGAAKDTWPLRLDATVGGHLNAGEEVEDALREVEEEIGVPAEPVALRWVGTRISVSETDDGVCDRELQSVFLWERDAPLDAYRPAPDEVDGLAEVAVTDLLDLWVQQRASIACRWLDAATGAISGQDVTLDDFVPSVDRYPYRVAIATMLALEGRPHIAI